MQELEKMMTYHTYLEGVLDVADEHAEISELLSRCVQGNLIAATDRRDCTHVVVSMLFRASSYHVTFSTVFNLERAQVRHA